MKLVLMWVGLLQYPVSQLPRPPLPPDSAAGARVEQQNARDSLAAGRLRWERAGVVEYRLQTHFECFCLPSPDTTLPHNLLTIRDGRIVARDVGKNEGPGLDSISWTVDSLFRIIAEDLQDPDRRVRRLELSQYGLPVRYEAQTTQIPDIWLRIAVDSFAVIRTAQPSPSPTAARKIMALNAWMKAYAARVGAVYLDYHSAMADERQGLRSD